jgi:hypothetical protein
MLSISRFPLDGMMPMQSQYNVSFPIHLDCLFIARVILNYSCLNDFVGFAVAALKEW